MGGMGGGMGGCMGGCGGGGPGGPGAIQHLGGGFGYIWIRTPAIGNHHGAWSLFFGTQV